MDDAASADGSIPIATPPPGAIVADDGCWLTVAPSGTAPSLSLAAESLHSPTPEQASQIQAAFDRGLRTNPRLFDGPVVYADTLDPATGRITASIGRFSRLWAKDEIDTGAVVIGVSGLLVRGTGPDRSVLLARRSDTTRVYGGLFELAPSGVLDAGDLTPRASITPEQVIATFLAELREELGINAASLVGAPTFRGLCYDPIASSLELIIAATLHPDADPTPDADRWEYTETRWVACDQAAVHANRPDARLTPPTALTLANLAPLLAPLLKP